MVRTITFVCAAIDQRQTSFLCRREEFKKPLVNDKIKPIIFCSNLTMMKILAKPAHKASRFCCHKAGRHAHKDSNSCHKDSEVPNSSIYSSEIQEGRTFRAYLLSSYPKFNPSKPRNKRQKRPGGRHGDVGRAPIPQAAKFIWCTDTPSTSTRYVFLWQFCYMLKSYLLHKTTIKTDKTVNRYLIC